MSRDFAKRPTVNGEPLGLESHELASHSDTAPEKRHGEALVWESAADQTGDQVSYYELDTSGEFVSTTIVQGFTYDSTTYAPTVFAKVAKTGSGVLDVLITLPDDAHFVQLGLDIWIKDAVPGDSYVQIDKRNDLMTDEPEGLYSWPEPTEYYNNLLPIPAQGGKTTTIRINTYHAEVEVYGLSGYFYTADDESGEWRSRQVSRPGHQHNFASLQEIPEEFPPSTHQHDHIENLEADSRLMDDTPSEYPYGVSSMPSFDVETVGTFGYEWDKGAIETTRYAYDEVNDAAIQVLKNDAGRFYWRVWNGATWDDWQEPSLKSHQHSAADITSGTLDIARLPDTILGGLDYQGTWNASTNSPNLGSLTKSKGDYWKVTTAGSTSLSGITDWAIGDWAVWDGSAFDKVDNSEAAGSVPDASTTVKGKVKTSVAPASSTDPIAVGDNDPRVPSADENDALGGTNGTPSSTNKYVTNSDSRNSDTRTPTNGSVTNAKVAADAAIDESKLNLASDAAAGTASRRTLGTGATQAAAGNDSRLSDARTPTSHAASHTNGSDDIQLANSSQKGLMSSTYASKLDGIESNATADMTAAEILTAIKTVDGSGSGLDADTLDGTSSAGFAAASHSHLIADLPVADDAESNVNEVVRSNDSRLSNARTPTSHAASHTNGSDDIQNATASQKGLATAAQITKLDGIETAATADQTPAEIRGAIKYADDANDGAAALSSYDTGLSYMYVTSSSSGWPIAATPFHILTMKQSGSSAKQVAIATTSAREWHRHWNGSAWTSWVEITDVTQLQGYSSLATDTEVASAISTHEAASDPHTGYQKESEKDANAGYVGRDANGGANPLNYIKLDRQASAPATPGSNGAHIYTYGADGITVLEGKTEGGGTFRFLRDQADIGYNNSGSTITKGSLVRVTGYDSGRGVPTIGLASNDAIGTMHAAGMATADITNNTSGRIWSIGNVSGLNTNGLTVGATLYLGTGGGFTTTVPSAGGSYIQILGEVLVADTTNGIVRLAISPMYVAAGGSGPSAATQVQVDAETDDSTYLTPLKHAAASLSHRKYDTGAAAVTTEGDRRYDSTRKIMVFHDSVREKAMNNQGFMPYAFPIGGGPTQASSTGVSMGVSGGANAIPIAIEGHMLLQSVSVWTTDTTQTRGPLEFGIYEDRLDSSNTLDLVTGAVGTLAAVAASAAATRTIPVTSPPIYLAPGIYWLILKSNGANANATWTMGVTAAGAMALNTWQSKVLTTSALGSTLDFVAATWTKNTTIPVVRLNGRVFGQTAAF